MSDVFEGGPLAGERGARTTPRLARQVLQNDGDAMLVARWDFMLSYTPTGARRIPTQAGDQGDPNSAMTIFDAVRKQLGLRLEMRKRMLPVVVIDHMEEKPIEN